MAHKRYLLFTFAEFYPSGGFDDLAGDFDTLEEAKDYMAKQDYYREYYQVYDREKGVMAEQGEFGKPYTEE